MSPSNPLLTALQNPNLFAHPVTEFHIVETHISWVLLTGSIAYKIKKPVDLGFLDFSTLEKRRYFCEEELRLNRRLAPEIYLDVVAITGSASQPTIGGAGPVFEYAVKMRQFPQDVQLDHLLEHQALTTTHVDALAAAVARFHQDAPRAPLHERFGAPEAVDAPMAENFRQIEPLLTNPEDLARLKKIRDWTDHAIRHLEPTLSQRRADGFVRECHGDLHLGNVAWVANRPLIFDCIEFNPALRWIDVISEVAFTVMDLASRRRPDLAFRFLNRYLEHSGDYAGLRVLRLYAVYRALVRCKVECIRGAQTGPQAADSEAPPYRGYLLLAERLSTARPTPVIITHGLSGSGKTTISSTLCERLGAIRVRSDVERKRLYEMAPLERGPSGLDTGIYTAEASARTYEWLEERAETVLQSGFPVLIDAAFLKRSQRERFAALAQRLQVAFVIVDCQSPVPVLEARVSTRARGATDASDAGLDVLAHQRASAEPLTEAERSCTLAIDTSLGNDAVEALLQRLAYAVCGASPCA